MTVLTSQLAQEFVTFDFELRYGISIFTSAMSVKIEVEKWTDAFADILLVYTNRCCHALFP